MLSTGACAGDTCTPVGRMARAGFGNCDLGVITGGSQTRQDVNGLFGLAKLTCSKADVLFRTHLAGKTLNSTLLSWQLLDKSVDKSVATCDVP